MSHEGVTEINYLTAIRFGFGALDGLADDIARLGMTRPLVVSDRGIEKIGLLARLDAALPADAAPRFLDTPSNPTEAAVAAAGAMYRSEGCDGLVAFGGGSSIDLAKAVALAATHDGPLSGFAAIHGGVGRITAAVAPLIAIPTTAGTGSEVGRAALITLEGGRKLGLVSPHLIPKRAICDPGLLIGTPAVLTAATGMDAMAHCIETFLSPRINPPAEAIALDGVARLRRHLERAVADGDDRAARWETMMASLQGGMTFQKGLGAVHGLSHALGGYGPVSLHHGLLNAVFLPPVLRLNATDATRDKYAALRTAMGLDPGANLADAIADLNTRIGLPASLSVYDLPDDIVEPMAEYAQADHSTATNPTPMTPALYERLLREVLTA
jgi:4-hydroxybutyrate dehydrogenase